MSEILIWMNSSYWVLTGYSGYYYFIIVGLSKQLVLNTRTMLLKWIGRYVNNN